MVDLKIIFSVVVTWLVFWHLIYVKVLQKIRPLAVVAISLHVLLLWLLISLLFYWVYLQSVALFWWLVLGVIFQLGYLIRVIAKNEAYKDGLRPSKFN